MSQELVLKALAGPELLLRMFREAKEAERALLEPWEAFVSQSRSLHSLSHLHTWDMNLGTQVTKPRGQLHQGKDLSTIHHLSLGLSMAWEQIFPMEIPCGCFQQLLWPGRGSQLLSPAACGATSTPTPDFM